MSLIQGIIQPQAFEVVRDRIGRIIAEEMTNQYNLSGITPDPDLYVTNWIERFIAFDKTELSAINVMLSEGSYSNQTQIQSDGTYRYFIDVYVNAKHKDGVGGDVRAMFKLQRLLGMVRAIIEDARYKHLSFPAPPGFVMNRHWESLQIQNPNNKELDALSSVMGRLTLSVRVPETTEYIIPTGGVNFITTVKLYSTDKGYRWERNNFYDPYDFALDV